MSFGIRSLFTRKTDDYGMLDRSYALDHPPEAIPLESGPAFEPAKEIPKFEREQMRRLEDNPSTLELLAFRVQLVKATTPEKKLNEVVLRVRKAVERRILMKMADLSEFQVNAFFDVYKEEHSQVECPDFLDYCRALAGQNEAFQAALAKFHVKDGDPFPGSDYLNVLGELAAIDPSIRAAYSQHLTEKYSKGEISAHRLLSKIGEVGDGTALSAIRQAVGDYDFEQWMCERIKAPVSADFYEKLVTAYGETELPDLIMSMIRRGQLEALQGLRKALGPESFSLLDCYSDRGIFASPFLYALIHGQHELAFAIWSREHDGYRSLLFDPFEERSITLFKRMAENGADEISESVIISDDKERTKIEGDLLSMALVMGKLKLAEALAEKAEFDGTEHITISSPKGQFPVPTIQLLTAHHQNPICFKLLTSILEHCQDSRGVGFVTTSVRPKKTGHVLINTALRRLFRAIKDRQEPLSLESCLRKKGRFDLVKEVRGWPKRPPRKCSSALERLSSAKLVTLGNDFFYARNGLAPNNAAAVRCFKVAAERGHPDGIHELAYMYRQFPVPQDSLETKIKWNIAAGAIRWGSEKDQAAIRWLKELDQSGVDVVRKLMTQEPVHIYRPRGGLL